MMVQEVVRKLVRLLGRWDRRLRAQQSLVWGPRGVLIGLVVAVLMAGASRLQPLLWPQQQTVLAALAVVLGLVGALVAVWASRRDAVVMARYFDRRFGLKERVSTALELASGRIRSTSEEISARQLSDTLHRAERIDARAYLPLRLRRREWAIMAALAALLALLLFTDNPQTQALAQVQAVQEAIQEQVAELENLRDAIEHAEGLDEEARQDLLEELDQAIETLSNPEVSQEEAVATLSDLAQDLTQAANQQPQLDPAQQQAFSQAAEELSEQAGDLSDALQEGALDQAAEALDALAGDLEGMSPQEQQDLAAAMEAAADALEKADPALAESLQEAADALEQGDTQAAQEAMQQAADQLEQTGQGQQQQPPGTEGAAQQLASQAAQQAEQGAQSVAQAGNADSGSTTGVETDTPGSDAAVPIGAEASQGSQSQSGEAGQSAQGQQALSGSEGQGAEAQEGENTTTSAGAGGGAGDSDAPAEEGGFASSGQQIPQNNEPDGEGLTDYEPVFAPQAIGGEGGPQVQLEGSDQPGDTVLDEGEMTDNPEGESLIGYDQVFSDYSNAANAALDSDYIPLGLRDVVHDYFSSLEPGN